MTWLFATLAVALVVGVVRLRPTAREDGLVAYVLVLLMAWLAAGSVAASAWVPHTDVLEPVALVATATTLTIARLSPRGTTYWLAIEVAAVAAIYAFTASAPWRLPDAFEAWVLGVRHNLDMAILVCLCGAVWLAAAWTGFWVSVRRSLLWALAPGALVLAAEVINDPGQSGLGTRVVAWIVLAAGLGMTLNLSRLQRRWGSRADDVTWRTAVSGGWALVGALTVALLLPPLTNQDISGRFFRAQTHAPETGTAGTAGGTGPGGPTGNPLQTGYTDRVAPGGALHRSSDVVLQVSDDWSGVHYWRGIDLYRVQDGTWDFGSAPRSTTRYPAGVTVQALSDASRKVVHAKVKVIGPALGTVFWPGEPDTVDHPATVLGQPGSGRALQQADVGYVLGPAIPTGATYSVTGSLSVATEAELRSATGADPGWVGDLALDPGQTAGIDRRVHDLAVQVTAGASNRYDQAKAVETYLRTLTYKLDISPPPRGIDPVTYFLFQTKTGYCEYFASSMGEMLRSLGIPVRLVNGYGPGTLSATQEQAGLLQPQSVYVVKASDAHTWVEVYFPGYGWVPFEPTPDPLYPPIPRGQVGAPTTQPAPAPVPVPGRSQQHAPQGAGIPAWGWVAGSLGLGTLAILWLLLTLLLGRPALRDLEGAWRRLGWLGRRLRVGARRSDTPLEFGRRLAAAVPPELGADIEAVASAYSSRCYAPADEATGDIDAAWRRVRRRLLPMLVLGPRRGRLAATAASLLSALTR